MTFRDAQVSEDVVRQFVRIAGAERAPRYLRFLKTILGPRDKPIKRSQVLIMQHVSQNRSCHSFFADCPERRDALIEANDHVNNPRGEVGTVGFQHIDSDPSTTRVKPALRGYPHNVQPA